MVEDKTEDTTTAPEMEVGQDSSSDVADLQVGEETAPEVAPEMEVGQDSSSDVADLQVGEETAPEVAPEVPESEDREAA